MSSAAADRVAERAPLLQITDPARGVNRDLRWLWLVSVLYFVVPGALFLAAFTAWYVAVPVGLALVAAVILDLRFEFRAHAGEARVRWTRRGWALLLIAAAAWTALFGAGYVGPQSGDQEKNQLIFADLFRADWPVTFPSMPDDMGFLSYPLGYYLVPALASKVLGWTLGTLVAYAWTALGVALVWCWLRVFFGRWVILAIPVFILFSGLDVIGYLLRGEGLPPGGTHLEWWSGWTFLQYSSDATVMTWSTQHTAAQWLLPALLVYRILVRRSVRGTVLLVSAAAFWSHLTILGVLVFLPLFLRRPARIMETLRDPGMLALPFLAVVGLFYASKPADVIDSAPIWELWPADWILPHLLVFVVLEFGVLVVFIVATRRFESTDERWLFWSAVVALLIIPIYHVGWSNDVSMRVSGIPLFVLFLAFVVAIVQSWQRRSAAGLVAAGAYLVVASATPVNEMFRQAYMVVPQQYFTAEVSDERWDRGVSGNCLLTVRPRDFTPERGDMVEAYRNDAFEIRSVRDEAGYLEICGPTTVTIVNRPSLPELSVARLSLHYFRDGFELRDGLRWRASRTPEQIGSILSRSPEQYTGTRDSFFYQYLLRR